MYKAHWAVFSLKYISLQETSLQETSLKETSLKGNLFHPDIKWPKMGIIRLLADKILAMGVVHAVKHGKICWIFCQALILGLTGVIMCSWKICHDHFTPHCWERLCFLQSLPTIHSSHQSLEQMHWFEATFKMFESAVFEAIEVNGHSRLNFEAASSNFFR